MKFIQQGFKGPHRWYHYLGGAFVIFLFLALGQGLFAGFISTKAHLNHPNTQLSNTSLSEMMKLSGLSANTLTFLLLFSFVIGLIGIFITVKYIHHKKLITIITSRKKIDWKRFFLSFGLIAIFITIMTVASYLSAPEDYKIQFEPRSFTLLFLIAVALVPLQAGFEELFFRGYLLQGFGVVFKNKWTPLLLTSIFFGWMHGSNPEVAKMGSELLIYYIGTGLFLGVITLMDDGIELSLGFHVANNLIQVLLVTSDYSVFQSPSVLKDISEPGSAWSEMLFPLLILYPLLIIYFAKKYKWKNWKEKLVGRVTYPQQKIEPDPS